ncbi:MAG: hypothetical protein II835_16585, partial [Fibrobacter sp.]|nr:hypothetical protein [Fibrobacter sp.]
MQPRLAGSSITPSSGDTPQRPERYKSNKRRECLTKVSSEERKADMVFEMIVDSLVLAANAFFR